MTMPEDLETTLHHEQDMMEEEDDVGDGSVTSNCSSSTDDEPQVNRRYWREQLEFLQECSDDDEDEEYDENKRFKQRKPTVKTGQRTRIASQPVGFDDLKKWFHVPMKEAALHFGVQITSLKKMCRRNGIKRWPHRQVRSLSRAIDSIMSAMSTATPKEKLELEHMVMDLQKKRQSVIDFPNKQQNGSSVVSVKSMGVGDEPPRASPQQRVRSKPTPLEAVPNMVPLKAEPYIKPDHDDDSPSTKRGGRWLAEEHQLFLEGLRTYGKNWKKVAQVVPTRSTVQIRTHAQKFFKRMSQERQQPPSPTHFKQENIFIAPDTEGSAWFAPVEFMADDCPSSHHPKFFDHRDFFPEFTDFDTTLEQFQF